MYFTTKVCIREELYNDKRTEEEFIRLQENYIKHRRIILKEKKLKESETFRQDKYCNIVKRRMRNYEVKEKRT